MTTPLTRRHFLGSAAVGLAGALPGYASAANKVAVAIIGTGGRGTEHAKHFAKLPDCAVAAVCDADEKRMNLAAEAVRDITGTEPRAVRDFRTILDDKSIDAVVIATCNHWHAPAAILACAAGKHVYVEKPCSHNPREGELLVAAARKFDRRVQMGNQRRSWPKVIEAIAAVRGGEIGRPYLAQSWYTANRGSIGRGEATHDAPTGLDYDLWQGPAPRRPFRSNYLHYTWHWFWHWGNGELGNNGIHMLDLCRWGMGVDFPTRATSAGGRYRFDDDQETPDTHTVAFDFATRQTITWEGLSCNQMPEAKTADVVFTGEKGSLAIRGGGYAVYDEKGKELRKVTGPGGDDAHVNNFLAAIRSEAKLTSEIEDGYRSTLLCHLGNIAHRTGRALRCDPKNGMVLDDRDAAAQWTREYEKGWEPKV